MKKILSVCMIVCIICVGLCGCKELQLNQSGNEKIKFKDDQVLFAAQDRCDVEDDRSNVYLYNHKGELLESSEYIGYYAENELAPAADQSTGKVGFVDKDGIFVIEPKYDDAAPFSKDGIALVKIKTKENGRTLNKCGYINSKGEEIVPCTYGKATSFFDCGYAIAVIERESDPDSDKITYMEDWKHCIIDKKGKVVVEFDVTTQKRTISAVFEDYFVCKTENGLAFYDYSNKKICEIKEETDYDSYKVEKDGFYKYKEGKAEKFDGKKFVEEENEMISKLVVKQVAITRSGFGYGVVENGETVIPFEYDLITTYGDYFVAIKYTGSTEFDQVFDIYDKNYNKTAENIPYAFYIYKIASYGEYCQLPNGYFQVYLKNDDYGSVHGIIDYTGKIIVEPVFGRGITLCTYEGTGVFELRG